MDKTNITIIGAGVCGLATGFILSQKYKDILIIEQHDSFGRETSSRNSEVIHAGIYYPKNSLKAKLCIKGKTMLYDLCQKHNIPHKKLGKILIACDNNEEKTIEHIRKNAIESGVTNLRFLKDGELDTLEPDIKAKKALLCPDTGIIDSHKLMHFFSEESKRNNVDFAYNIKVVNITKKTSKYKITVKEPSGELFSFETNIIINAGGFYADQIASMAGIDIEENNYKIYYSKGQYFRINNPKKFNIKHLIYPPPSATDLGIHITPDLAGGLRLGPDAAFVDCIDYAINERDKEKFQISVSRFLEGLSQEDLAPDTCGIRAKLQSPTDKFRDFVIAHEKNNGLEGFVNLLGIESPGLTSCLAIAEMVKDLL
ncbi:MAG: NAD(P)/FAD-dependent oxidoreductase [Candidatus Omnitrophica bacterium]|nr:NAD(P)/FAD-dependent oxidoreductase [Candidatus Omnitrophota bacterium]